MKYRLSCILLFLMICNFSFGLNLNTRLEVPLTSNSKSLTYTTHNYTRYRIGCGASSYSLNRACYGQDNGTFGTSYNTQTINALGRNYSAYSGCSVGNGILTRRKSYERYYSASISYAPGRTYTYTCPMCGGTGYINDNGNGEIVSAYWWRQETGYAGDGTYCDGVESYHDPCDAEWSETGGTYHHDYKRTCPQCGGAGTVTSNSRKKPSTLSGWVQWYGESWSHAYSDNDNDGHCDEHYWHVSIEFDCRTIIVLMFMLSLYVSFKNIKEKGSH